MKVLLCISTVTMLLILTSCNSTLRVHVDAFDMAKLKASGQYKLEEKGKELAYYNTRLKSKYYPEAQQSLTGYVRRFLENDTNFAPAALDPVLALVDSTIHNRLNALKAREAQVRDALESLVNVSDSAMQRRYDTAFADFILEKQRIVSYLDSLGTTANISESERDIFKAGIERFNRSIATAGIFGNVITDDRMASFVAKAPEEYWQKYQSKFYTDEAQTSKSSKKARINETYITTLVGNSDVAIKMDGPGNFVIKGVRLDADQAFRTSFKVLSQSIQYFGATAGIPLPTKTPTATPSAPGTSGYVTDYLATAESNRQSVANLDAQYVQLTSTFLNIVDTYKADLTSANLAKRSAAIKAVKAAYLFYKSQITIQ